MSTITGSVGRGGANRPDDVRLIQDMLNQNAAATGQTVDTDGRIGPKTIAAIEAFQRAVVGMANPDGRIDPGGKSFQALSQGGSAAAPATGDGTLPTPGTPAPLTDADFQRAAAALNCEVACVQAVTDVESGGSGFFASGRPKILFEAHYFSRLTQHRYDASNPQISSAKWNRALYAGGEKEYGRLQSAMALNRDAALRSASWGRFQIMGDNCKAAGYASADEYVAAMYQSEGKHLDAFVNFVKSSKLDGALREKRWADFAKGYNGSGYAENQYDKKLAAAYKKHAG